VHSSPFSDRPDIALYGRSGAGKSEIAQILVADFGYTHYKTGDACREIARRLFGSEDKTLLNRITDALRAIDNDVWLRAALPTTEITDPIVFDSLRFPTDYEFLQAKGFALWRVEAPPALRVERLAARGQQFDPQHDESHPAEVSLAEHMFDVTIENDFSSLADLRAVVKAQLPDG